MLGPINLERESFNNDLGVIMEQNMCFTKFIDVMVGKALLAILGFIAWCAQSLNMRVMCGLVFMMYTSTGFSGCIGS
jgi:hypothetical protein